MIERIKNESVLHQRDYIEAENKAYENLINSGYSPQGYNFKNKKVVVMKIENEHTNNEHKEVYYFENWQEAEKNLIGRI